LVLSQALDLGGQQHLEVGLLLELQLLLLVPQLNPLVDQGIRPDTHGSGRKEQS